MQKGLPNRLNAKILDVLGGPIRSSKDKRASSFFRDGSAGIAYDFTSAANLLWRYNLLTWSEDFTNAAWAKANGAVSGTRFTPNTTAAVQHRIDQVSAIPAGPQVLWAELKYAGYQWVSLRIGANGAAFDIQNGVVGGVVSGTTATITPLGNGNYLCAFFDPNAAASATSRINVEPSDTIGGQFAGDGINGLDIIRAQREVGSTINPYQKITDPDMDAVFRCPQNPLYQDTTGSMAVTTPDETVGLALDTSRGLALGPELVTNGDFSAGNTGWTRSLPSWDAASGKMVNDGTNSATTASVQQAGVVSAGKTYRIAFDLICTSGSANLWLAASQLVKANISASGRVSFTVLASVTGSLFIEANISSVLSIDNISVREINSVPLLQANAGLRPKWGRAPKSRRNLLTETEFRNGVTDAPTRGGLLSAVSGVDFKLFTGTGLAFGYDGTTLTYAYKTLTTLAATYVFSAIVVMDTDGAPAFGSATGTSPLNDMLLSGGASPLTYVVEALGGRVYRVSTVITTSAGLNSFGVAKYGTNSSRTFSVSGYQFELAAKSTYQKVTTAFDMTESGVPSYGFIRHDLVDDVLSATIPVAQTGDVLVFGRKGSWIESGVTYGAGSTWSVGATTVTGLPAGLLSAIGDIVGIIAIGRALTATERQQAFEYHKARGAAGWLVAGAEMLTNGDFSAGTTGWASGATLTSTASVVSGEMQVTATVGSGRQLQAKTLVVGQPYLLTGMVRRISGTGGAYLVAGFNTEFNSANSVPVTGATATASALVFIPTTTVVNIGLSGSLSGDVCGFDSVSLKPLTVAA